MSALGFSLNRENVNLFSSFILAASTFLLSAFLLLFVDLPRGLFWSAVQNSGHTLVFALLTLACLFSIGVHAKTKILPARNILIVVLLISIFSSGIEFVQSLMGREASMGDMVLNGAGIVVGTLLFIAYRMGRLYNWVQLSLLLIALIILGVNFRHPVRYAVANMLRPSLPVLADFEHVGASSKVEANYGATVDIVNGSKQWLTNGSKVLQVQFPPGKWPGFTLLELHANWTEYAELRFEVFNPSENVIEATFRIHDLFHNNEENDRFSKRLMLNSGASTVSIPIEDIRAKGVGWLRKREIDIANMQALKVYTTKVQFTNILLFDNFYLR